MNSEDFKRDKHLIADELKRDLEQLDQFKDSMRERAVKLFENKKNSARVERAQDSFLKWADSLGNLKEKMSEKLDSIQIEQHYDRLKKDLFDSLSKDKKRK